MRMLCAHKHKHTHTVTKQVKIDGLEGKQNENATVRGSML